MIKKKLLLMVWLTVWSKICANHTMNAAVLGVCIGLRLDQTKPNPNPEYLENQN
ncbi:hypothetical protein HanIR_Chr09g0412691 [Helianthus annuus]|nr:hypothetical protein HanIR_Chr09g0412691 [Helianthus annuus]